MSDWPTNYDPTTHTRPSLTKDQCMAIGSSLALTLVSDEKICAKYLAIVKQYYRDPTKDTTTDFKNVLGTIAPEVNVATFNQHDFANIHRAAWLKIVRSLSRLVALNPFESKNNTNPWADPLPDGSTENRVPISTNHGEFFFDIPSSVGFYALTHQEFEAFEKVPLGPLLPESLFLV